MPTTDQTPDTPTREQMDALTKRAEHEPKDNPADVADQLRSYVDGKTR